MQLCAADSWRSKLTSTAQCSPHGACLSGTQAAIVLSVMLAFAPASVLAETQVRGNLEAVIVNVQNSSIAEILAALSNRFGVRYRSSANLEKRISGTYTGSLQQVVARVLAGYNFFVKAGEGVDITVLGPPAAGDVVQPSAPTTFRGSSPQMSVGIQGLMTPMPTLTLPASGSPAAPEVPERDVALPAPPVPSGLGSMPIPTPANPGDLPPSWVQQPKAQQ
jgi:hypothetical protein